MNESEISRREDAPVSHDLPALKQLAQALTSVNYTYEAIASLMGEGAFAAMARDVVIPGRHRVRTIRDSATATATERNLALAIAFFMLGETFTAEEINQAMGADTCQLLVDLHLAVPATAVENNTTFRAAVDVRPHSADDGTELWVASDLGAHQRPGVLRKDHVLGVGQASLSLAQFTVRTPVAQALDLGTGCGIQTFHLLAHADHVTATDISPRALAFARFNLLLNAPTLNIDAENLEERVSLRLGSLTEPVAGERFDIIVSNPPFVITPRHENETAEEQFTYRDGGLAGDGIVSTLVRELPGLLTPGGYAQMLGNWEIPVAAEGYETDWSARPREWVGENTEAWFIQREELSPEQYAETWLRDASENRDPTTYERAYLDYLKDFSARGVNSIGFGMIWLRAPQLHTAGEQMLQRFEEITYPIQQPIASFFADAVAHHDAVAPLTDDHLDALHLVVASDVTEERHGAPGAEHPGVILLRQGAGLRRTVLMASETAGFVSACDGELTVGQISGALAALLDWDDDAPRTRLRGHVRELIDQGFLLIDRENTPESTTQPKVEN